MAYCTSKCQKYKAPKPVRIGRYASGQKRCNHCTIFLNFEGSNCPCCGRQLRCLPRSRKGKELFAAQVLKR